MNFKTVGLSDQISKVLSDSYTPQNRKNYTKLPNIRDLNLNCETGI